MIKEKSPALAPEAENVKKKCLLISEITTYLKTTPCFLQGNVYELVCENHNTVTAGSAVSSGVSDAFWSNS